MKKSLLTLSSFLFLGGFLFGQGLPVSQGQEYKNAILEELTGINCTWCPDGHRIANDIADGNAGRVILVNIHAGTFANTNPNFKTVDGDRINSFMTPSGYPTGSVHRTPYGGSITSDRGSWSGQVDNILNQESPANVGMSATIDPVSRLLKVKVEIFYTEAQAAGTKHFLNVGILQDDLVSAQAGANKNPSAILPNGMYQHKHMFRGFVNEGGTWGDEIDATQTGVITKEYEYTLPAEINANDLDISKLSFYSFLHVGKTTKLNSPIITGAQVNPTFINVPAGTVNLVSFEEEYNVGCNSWTSIMPKVKVQNMGAALNKMAFVYTVNGDIKAQFEVNEALGELESKTITLPELAYYTSENAEVGVRLISVDGSSTGVGSVDYASTIVKSAAILTDPNFTLEILTDAYPGETSIVVFKGSVGNSVFSYGPYAGAGGTSSGGPDALKVKSHDIQLTDRGCFTLRLKDSYGDGMQYGVNTNGGFGFRVVQNGNVLTSILKDNFDFGSYKDFQIAKYEVLGTTDLDNQVGLSIYPNPTKDEATLQLNLTTESNVKYEVVNMLGQIMSSYTVDNAVGSVQETINTSGLSAGQYIVNVFVNNAKSQKILTVVK